MKGSPGAAFVGIAQAYQSRQDSMFFEGEVFFRGYHFQHIVTPLDAKAVQGHPQQFLPLRRVEIATGPRQILKRIPIVRKNTVSVLSFGIDLDQVVVPVQRRRRDLDQSPTSRRLVLSLSQAR
jgi:hypothetical protein